MVKGRLTVDEFLHVSGHREVYPIGDAAAVPDLTKPLEKGGLRPVCPPTAQHAMRQATAVARNIRAGLGRGAVSRTGTATSAWSSTSADRTPPPVGGRTQTSATLGLHSGLLADALRSGVTEPVQGRHNH